MILKVNMYSIKYSNQAELDLEGAIAHIAQESITNAMNYLFGYEEKIELFIIRVYHASVDHINKFNHKINELSLSPDPSVSKWVEKFNYKPETKIEELVKWYRKFYGEIR